VLGKDALAQETQLFIHKTFDLITPSGWKYQVKNEVGLNAQAQYWHEFIPESWRKKWLDIHGTSQVMIGNTFTNASVGLLFQVGLFARVNQSSLYDARIDRGNSTGRKSTELYAFFHPSYQYQLYNATVQGGLFNDNRGSVLSPLEHWGYRNDVGFVFSKPRWTGQLVYSFKQREAAIMRHDEQYIGLTTSYRFGH